MSERPISDTDDVLVVCNMLTATRLTNKGIMLSDMIISETLADDQVIVVPQQEFLDWLEGKNGKTNYGNL